MLVVPLVDKRWAERTGKEDRGGSDESKDLWLAKDDYPTRTVWIFRIFYFFWIWQEAQNFISGWFVHMNYMILKHKMIFIKKVCDIWSRSSGPDRLKSGRSAPSSEIVSDTAQTGKVVTSFDSVTLTVSPVSFIKKLFDVFPALCICLLLDVVSFGAFVGSTFVLRFDSKPAKQIRNLSFQRMKHMFK